MNTGLLPNSGEGCEGKLIWGFFSKPMNVEAEGPPPIFKKKPHPKFMGPPPPGKQLYQRFLARKQETPGRIFLKKKKYKPPKRDIVGAA
ncbi:hypothetical protein, partial [Ralstonia solanacearum]|uniref:hypothetical protein n=1 Tax=Ralstonia solanacearum TaxID=305 RepID=UPI0019D39447